MLEVLFYTLLAVIYALCGVITYGRTTTYFWYSYPRLQSESHWIETRCIALGFAIVSPAGMITSYISKLPRPVEYRWRCPSFCPPEPSTWNRLGYLVDTEFTNYLIRKIKFVRPDEANICLGILNYRRGEDDMWGVIANIPDAKRSFNIYIDAWYYLRCI